MTGSDELLILRLALLAVIFLFLLVVVLTLRAGLPAPRQMRRPAARRGGGPSLTVLAPGETMLARGTSFAVAGRMIVGRDGTAGILLPDASVSANHAAIERRRDGWVVSDLDSTNGTLLNGRGLRGTARLEDGDELAFGNVVVQFSE